MKHTSARVKLLLAMVLFGTLGPFVRQIGISSGELALCRAVMAAALVGGVLLLRGGSPSLSAIRRELPLLLLSGAAMGVNWILLFEAYRYTTVSLATLSYYFAPVIVLAACPLLFREKMTRRQLLCFLMSTLGLVLIVGVAAPGEGRHLTGVLFGLGAACLYASVVLLNKKIQGVSGLDRTLLQFLAAIAVMAPYVALGGGLHFEVLTAPGWVCLLIVGLVHTGLAYCLYFSAIRDLRGQETAILSYADPLVAVLVSVLFLGEGITALQLLGGGLILGFTLLNELSGASGQKSSGGY